MFAFWVHALELVSIAAVSAGPLLSSHHLSLQVKCKHTVNSVTGKKKSMMHMSTVFWGKIKLKKIKKLILKEVILSEMFFDVKEYKRR